MSFNCFVDSSRGSIISFCGLGNIYPFSQLSLIYTHPSCFAGIILPLVTSLLSALKVVPSLPSSLIFQYCYVGTRKNSFIFYSTALQLIQGLVGNLCQEQETNSIS